MGVKRGGLGRNLTALLGTGDNTNLEASVTNERQTLAVSQLQPGKYQPRQDMDEPSLMELAASIKQQGVLQPLIVRQIKDQQFEIIAGERRWRASQIAGLQEVPVIVRQVDDETAIAMALIENLQREDLNAMDQARAMQRLYTEFKLTHQQIAEVLCKSRTAVSNYLRLLNLNLEVRRLLEHGDLEMGHARCLLTLEDHEQATVAQLIVAKELSVREAEALVSRMKAPKLPNETATRADIMPLYNEQLHRLTEHLQAQVKLKQGKAGKGMLVIHYENTKILEQLLGQLLATE